MDVPVRWSTSRGWRAVLTIALLIGATLGVTAPTRAYPSSQEADPPVGAEQIGSRIFAPLVQDVQGGTPNATAWLRLSAPTINPGSFFSLTVLTKSTGTAPEPFVNVFVTYNTGLIDFQSANTVPGDFVTTSVDGFSVQFNGPLAPGQERYATIVFRARAGVTNADVRFGGSYEAANNASGNLPRITLPIGGGQIHPIVRFACEFGRGGSGPLGQNPGGGNNPFGTPYTFGAFRRDNGGCGFTFSPGARVSYWVAQPTGPSVPTNIYSTADSFGEVQITYNTRTLLNNCPVNLCAFAMNASSDNSYVLVAPFNLTRPPLAGSAASVPATISAAEDAPIATAQTGTGGLQGRVTGSDGSPLEGVVVYVYTPEDTDVVATATTDAAGNYSIQGKLAAGAHTVAFDTSLSNNPNTQRYAGTVLPVVITPPFVAVLNATLQPGGTISGRVTAEGSAALPEVLVWVYDATQSEVLSVVATDANGNYTTDALPSGNYIVQFDATSSGNDASTGYAGEYHNEQPLGTPPTPVTVTAPATTANVNGTLARCATCGAIEGRVTAQDGGGPLTDVTVIVRNAANGQQVAVENTDENGVYHTLVPAGTYSVEFFTDVSPLAQVRSYLDNYATPTSIQVTAPAVVSGINSVLARGGQIAGRVTAAGGAGLPDVVVAVYGPNNTLLTTTITGADGSYATPALANGSYTVQFQPEVSPTEATRAYKPASRTVSITAPGLKDGNNVTLSR